MNGRVTHRDPVRDPWRKTAAMPMGSSKLFRPAGDVRAPAGAGLVACTGLSWDSLLGLSIAILLGKTHRSGSACTTQPTALVVVLQLVESGRPSRFASIPKMVSYNCPGRSYKTFTLAASALKKRPTSLSPSMVGADRSERTFARKISYKVSQGADATTAATYAILKRIDRINPESHDPTPQGGMISLALLVWMAFFLIFLVRDWATAPLGS